MKWRNLESIPNKKQTILVLMEFPFKYNDDFITKKAIWFADYTPPKEHEKWEEDGYFKVHLGIDTEPYMGFYNFSAKSAGFRGWMPIPPYPQDDERSDDELIRKMFVETATRIEPRKEPYVCIFCFEKKVMFEGNVISNNCKCKDGAYFYAPLSMDDE